MKNWLKAFLVACLMFLALILFIVLFGFFPHIIMVLMGLCFIMGFTYMIKIDLFKN